MILVLSRSQPFWWNGQVGPGMFAQLSGAMVLVLGVAWGWLIRHRARQAGTAPGMAAGARCASLRPLPFYRQPGPALLGSVLVFALGVEALGLVVTAGLAAGLAGYGAGDRGWLALGGTVVGLSGLAALIGMTLLPPTAPLWPAGWNLV